jgi:hypothetical protein
MTLYKVLETTRQILERACKAEFWKNLFRALAANMTSQEDEQMGR